jgi:hypothetical protein
MASALLASYRITTAVDRGDTNNEAARVRRLAADLMDDVLGRATLFRVDRAACLEAAAGIPKVMNTATFDDVETYCIPPYEFCLFEMPDQTVGTTDGRTMATDMRTGLLVIGNLYIPCFQHRELAGCYPYGYVFGDSSGLSELAQRLQAVCVEKDTGTFDLLLERARDYWHGIDVEKDARSSMPASVSVVSVAKLGMIYAGFAKYRPSEDISTAMEAIAGGIVQRMMWLIAYLNKRGPYVAVNDRKPKVDGRMEVAGQFVPRYHHSVVTILADGSPPRTKGEPGAWPGPRKMNHPVRAHVRHMRSGKIVQVHAHRRGDVRLGVKTSEYVIAGHRTPDPQKETPAD